MPDKPRNIDVDVEVKDSGVAQEPGRPSRRIGARTASAAGELARALGSDAFQAARGLGSRLRHFRRNVNWAAPVGRAATELRLLLATIAIAVLVMTGGLTGIAFWAMRDVKLPDIANMTSQQVILLETADGRELVRKGPLRLPKAALADFPKHLVEAVLSIEDRRFYQHWGIDPLGIARALARNVAASDVVEGGSTITQQLIKILHLDADRTVKRKVQEALLAIWLELRLSKDEILTAYLNNVYLGAGATGMPAAAKVYFGKDVGELSVAESAVLAGLIRAPSQLNPLRNPEAAGARAGVVLGAMVENGKLDRTSADAARSQPVRTRSAQVASRSETWFADWAHAAAAEIAGSFGGTVRVRTTFDPGLQQLAEKAVADVLDRHGPAKGATQAALVAMRPDGAVLAMVGGRNYQESEFNRAVHAMRQPGSAFKLFVYYAALRNGLSLDDAILDAPIEINGWEPENFGQRHHGRVSLAEAFARSLNTAAVRLAQDVGIDEVIAAARDLGIDAPLTKTPSLALGTSEVSLLDLTGAFASVRAGVTPVEPWGIAGFGSADQARLFAAGPSVKPQRSLARYQRPLTELLELVVETGTGRAAALDGLAAGKTGTSQSFRDAWFIGFSEPLVVGVWVGNDDDRPMKNVTGGSLPAVIWKSFMSEALPRLEKKPMQTVAGDETTGSARAAVSSAPEPHAGQCNYRSCESAYRSFRASDCTYQPYGGPRRLCEK
jgi:1A family penicillin-binding protein